MVTPGREKVTPVTFINDQDRISPYHIKQKSDESKEKYQQDNYQLIQHQILRLNIMRIEWQIVRRITNEVQREKGLIKKYNNNSKFQFT